VTKPPATSETSLAQALGAEPALLDRLSALHSFFRRFRNPLLRRTMGRLLTFADAAKLTGLPLDVLLDVANGAEAPAAPASGTDGPAARPEWVDEIDPAKATRFDARAWLARGEDPLDALLRCAAAVGPSEVLVVDAPFDPLPLRRVLGNRGFSAFAEALSEDHWRVYFRREESAGAPAAAEPAATAGGARIWTEGGSAHIDVRGLVPPEPLLAIVELLERPDTGQTVIVHHERDPVYLYPELAERGWTCENIPGEPGEVRLRLSRERRRSAES